MLCCLNCSNMLCGKAWADLQGDFCCLRLAVTWTLLLFSLTDSPALFSLPLCLGGQESFVRAKNWVKELQRQASPNIVIALAGNKADLANKRALDFQVGVVSTCHHWRSHTRLLGIEPVKQTSPCERRLCCFIIVQDAQSYADDNSLLFMETSAKTSMNVNEIFMAIGELQLRPHHSPAPRLADRQSILIFVQRWTERLKQTLIRAWTASSWKSNSDEFTF